MDQIFKGRPSGLDPPKKNSGLPKQTAADRQTQSDSGSIILESGNRLAKPLTIRAQQSHVNAGVDLF